MRQSICRYTARTLAVALVGAIALGVAAIATAQKRPAIPEGVELIVPVAPQTIRMAGTTYLVHELHITNLLTVDVELLRVQVVAAAPAGGSIADHAIDDLAKRMGRPGLPRNHETPRVLGAGMRAVVYFWIDLAHAPVPASLRHRVELIIRRPSPVQATIEGGPAHVAKTDVPVLDPPLRGGPWVTIYDPDLKGGHRTAIYTLDGRPRIPGRFAIDLVRLSAHGAIEPQSTAPKGDWNGYGSDVLAVADATVAAAADDIADNPLSGTSGRPPVPLENASGNYVALNLGGGRFAFYEHLKQGSIRVTSGQKVRRGDALGQLGNSGSTSIGPHLHFHVSDAASLLGAEGLPYVFATFEQLGSFESIAALVGGKPWQAGPGGRTLRALEFPVPNAVVRFR